MFGHPAHVRELSSFPDKKPTPFPVRVLGERLVGLARLLPLGVFSDRNSTFSRPACKKGCIGQHFRDLTRGCRNEFAK
jgi:hypothetical protein